MKTLQIRMTDDERRRLEIAAEAEGRSLNNHVMKLVRKDLEFWDAQAKREENL